MKKGIGLLAVLLCGMLAIIVRYKGKNNAEHTCAELKTNFMREILTYDPRIAEDSDSLQMDFFIYCGLTSLDAEGNVHLELAESYTVSEDQKTYCFTLKDVHWSDGTPLTAYDFEESWKEYSDERFPASLWTMVSMIKNHRGKNRETAQGAVGFKALNAKTVEIQLEYPVSYFLQLLAHPTLFPVHHSMRGAFFQHRAINPSALVCSGPFKIQNYKEQVEIVLEKNARFHDPSRVKLDRVHMSRVKDASTTLAMFEKGELDWLGLPLSELPLDALEELKQRGVLENHPLLDARFLYFNTKEYPFTNANLRKALTFAIDRRAIIKDIMQTDYQQALGYVPYAQKKERWHPYFQDNDAVRAKNFFVKALEELHISAAEFPEIVIAYNTSETWQRVMQAIQEQWRKVLGIRVKIENTDWQVHMDRMKKGDYQIARGGRTADFIDSLAFLQPLLSYNTAQNFCRWENKEFDTLVFDAEQVKSDAEKYALFEKAEMLVIEEMPIAPLMYFTAYSLAQKNVKGVVVSPLYYVDLSRAYLEK